MFCSRLTLALAAVICCTTVASPSGWTTGCGENVHCNDGYYCDSSKFCSPCLRCGDLKRKPPSSAVTCVTSVAECGPCNSGMTEDRITKSCLSPFQGQSFSAWAVISIVVLSLVAATLISVITVRMLRNLPYLKIFTSTTIQPREKNLEEATTPPPPYNTVALLPKSDTMEDNQGHKDGSGMGVTESRPFIQAIPRTNLGGSIRECAQVQGARVFHDPVYNLGPQVSSETPSANRTALVSLPEVQELPDNVERDNTMNELTEALGAEVRPLIRPNEPPLAAASFAKLPDDAQDSNNNSGSNRKDSESSYVQFDPKNCLLIFNQLNVVQKNDVTI